MAQLDDPLPDIPLSSVVLEVEDWLDFPDTQSQGGGQGVARLSHFRNLPDGRMFANDMRGPLYLISPGSNVISEFLNVKDVIGGDFKDDEGLGTGFHSFAFHPDFASNGLFYTNHVEEPDSGSADLAGPLTEDDVDQQAVLMEWQMSNPSASVYDGGAPREVLRIDVRSNTHSLQEITFNPTSGTGDADYGLLYICMGDGGSVSRGSDNNPSGAENDVGRNDSPLGTIMRIFPGTNPANPSQYQSGEGSGYRVPVSNPFANTAGALGEIYAYGFRNPHRMSWDPATGVLYAAGIGQKQIEEVNIIEPGFNYGWPHREGTFLFDIDDPDSVYPLPSSDNNGFTYPVAQYDHSEGFGIAGGYVYRGSLIPDLVGKYVFGDIVKGWIYQVDTAAMTQGNAPAAITEISLVQNGVPVALADLVGDSRADLRFAVDPAGELLVITKTDGKIRKLKPSTGPVTCERHWVRINHFDTNDLSQLQTTVTGGGSADVTLANDPYGDPTNTVLCARPTTNAQELSLSLPIDDISDTGTLYVRMAFESQDVDTVWGFSDVAMPDQWSDFEASVRLKDGDDFDVRNGSSYQDAGIFASQTWYEIWIVAANGTDRFDVWVKGGMYSLRTRLVNGADFRNGTGDPLRSIFWQIQNSNGNGANQRVYIDDIYVDFCGSNLTNPLPLVWSTVDDFENGSSGTEVGGGLTTNLVTSGGNTCLEVSANHSSSSTQSSCLVFPLPESVGIGSIETFYGRIAVGAGNLGVQFGLTNESLSAISSSPGGDIFETRADVAVTGAGATIEVADGSSEILGGAFPTDEWMEFWIVADNQGGASLGQRYTFHLRGGPFASRTQIGGGDLVFVKSSESPLLSFVLCLETTYSGQSPVVKLDDLQVFTGENLATPGDPIFVPLCIEGGASGVDLTFESSAARTYRVQFSNDLAQWMELSSHPGTSGEVLVSDPFGPQIRRFYRVIEE